jgi:hypothetical protein
MRDIKNNNVSGDTKKFLDIKTIWRLIISLRTLKSRFLWLRVKMLTRR